MYGVDKLSRKCIWIKHLFIYYFDFSEMNSQVCTIKTLMKQIK